MAISKELFPTQEPIIVQSKVLDLRALPDWREILEELPVGVGVKGGIARKILKVISGLNHQHPDFAAEMNGNGDIDILVAVSHATPGTRLVIRQEFSGRKLGHMEVLAKDIEVCDDLSTYFKCRDVTMNEVLAFRTDHDNVILYYTEAAQRDIESGTIAPSIHCLKTIFGQIWQLDDEGRFVVAHMNLERCIIRWVKGHGLYYRINQETWDYYKKHGLSLKSLFKIMRNFVGDDQKFYQCHRHLVGLGLVDRNSDANTLWGSCLLEVNTSLARHGFRLTFGEPTAEQIEEWICRKEQEFQNWQTDRATKISIGLRVEPDIEAPVYLPDGIQNFPACFE